MVLGGVLLIFVTFTSSDSSSFNYQAISIKGTGIAAVVLEVFSYIIGLAIDADKDADLD